jgi:predicted nucleotidyltransferase
LTPDHPFVPELVAALETVYGSDLVSVAIFGSVARRTARDDSDLDLFVAVAGLPAGRGARLATFQQVRKLLQGALSDLARASWWSSR